MTAISEQAEYSVQILIRDWLLIDGTMDNHVQSAIDGAEPDDLDEEAQDGDEDAQDGDWHEEDDHSDDEDQDADWDEGPDGDTETELEDTEELPRVTRLGTSIRQAGWDQIPGWPHDAEGFRTWPAPGQLATMTLTGAQWKLVVSALHYWAQVAESLSDAETAAESRAIATTVAQRLAEQGWSPGSP